MEKLQKTKRKTTNMIVYHVCSYKKFLRYQQEGGILPPVRAWKCARAAAQFSKQTGRIIILRLKFPENAKELPGHKHNAVYLDRKFDLPKDILPKKEKSKP